jgi:hypothetical protein
MECICADCMFFDDSDMNESARARGNYVEGLCRRHAPTWVVDEDSGSRSRNGWPTIGEADWCGEFKPRAMSRAKAT